MKRIIIAVLCVLGLVSALDAQEKKGVMTLSSKEFKTKVYDISAKNPEYLGSKPAIVDFYASWCGPCRAISPVLEELAKEYGDKIVIYKVDVDASRDIAQAFGIRSIPAVLFIPMKGEAQMTVGGRSKEDFKKQIDTILLGK
ncbi:MAG: thioredoxin [Bacteroidales bacterium]|jgi:thioredoxin|nr:thioredoxin [Bacteroidales bacterium]